MGLTSNPQDEIEESDAWITAMAYAAWGKFIELTGNWIPWATVVDVAEPVTTQVENDEHGNLFETVIRITHRGTTNEETKQD